jgi:DNA repair exonuclease SbcCD nuclease subunit
MTEALTSICAGFGTISHEHEGPHICLGHFSVRGAKISPTQQMMGYDIEMSADQLALAAPTLWCLGHIHHAQEVAPGVLYSGSLYRVDFGERESTPGFWVHNIISAQDDTAKWLHDVQSIFHKTPASSMSKVKLDIVGDEDARQDEITIEDSEIADKMQVEIKCYSDQIEVLDYHIIKEDLIARGAKEVDVIIQRIPRPNIRSAKILAVESLREKLIARAEITDEEVAPGVLEKADLVETMKAEAVLNIIKKTFEKGESK